MKADRCECHGWLDCPVINRVIQLQGKPFRVVEDGIAEHPLKRPDGKPHGLKFRVLRVVPA